MNSWRLLYLLTLLALSSRLYAQHDQDYSKLSGLSAIQISSESGLPCNEVYRIVQDSLGYLWLATDYGIYKYNGNTFHKIALPESINDMAIIDLIQDSEGRIWYVPMNNQIGFIKNNSCIEYPYNDLINNTFKDNLIISFQIDNSNTIYLSSAKNYNLIINSDGKVLKPENQHRTKNSFGIYQSDDGSTYYSEYRSTANLDALHIEIDSITLPVPNGFINNRTDFNQHDEELFFWVNNHLFAKTNSNKIKQLTFNTEVNLVKRISDSSIAVLSSGAGIFILNNNFEIVDRSLKNELLTDIEVDMHGGLWISTYYNGIYHYPNSSIRKGGIPDELINSHLLDLDHLNQNELLVLNSENEIWQKKADNWKLIYKSKTDKIKFIQPIADSIIISSLNSSSLLVNGEAESSYAFSVYFSYFNSEGNLLVGSPSGIFHFDSLRTKLYNATPVTKSPVYHRLLTTDNREFFIARRGIIERKTDTWVENCCEVDSRVTCIAEWNGQLAIGTKTSGLLLKSLKETESNSPIKILDSHRINCLDSDSTNLYVGAEEGLYIINRNSDTSQELFSIREMNVRHGLPSNNITDLAVKNDTLWIGTTQGLRYMKLPFPKIERPYTVYFSDARLNDSISINDGHEYNYYMNTFTANFDAVILNEPHILEYRYKLSGLEQDWSITTNNQVKYERLNPGNYQFQLEARCQGSSWIPVSYSPKFSILKPWWNELWTQIIGLLILALLLYSLVIWRLNQVRKENDFTAALNRRMAESELLALRSQINPHFTFNVMSSIQSYLLNNDAESASHYITRFSSFMRHSLDDSLGFFTTLKKEWKGLETYVELEHMRFPEKFEYRFSDLSESKLGDIRIPAMILQPHVENAIRHGLVPRDSGGKLLITVSQNEKELVICVEDNGVGRKKTNQVHDDELHIGIKNVNERISLLKQLHQIDCEINIVDLVNEQNEASGTRVCLIVPLSM